MNRKLPILVLFVPISIILDLVHDVFLIDFVES